MNQTSGDNLQPRSNGGVFDKKNTKQDAAQKPPVEHAAKKEDFKDEFAQQRDNVAEMSTKQRAMPKDDYTNSAANQINSAMKDDPLLDDEEDKLTEEDIKLAEKLIFDGFAEYDAVIKSFPDHKFTMCSTSAEDIGIVDEIEFDMLKNSENDDGVSDISNKFLSTMRNALMIAIGYKGMDKKELCDNRSQHLNVIKKAVIKVSDLESDGSLDEAIKLKASLKDALLKRARKVRKMPTPVIDFLSTEKYKFDEKMYNIITSKRTLPKS